MIWCTLHHHNNVYLNFKENSNPIDYLKEMQCMWFETECANAYMRLNRLGESLKQCLNVEKVYLERPNFFLKS
jgi:hypothetical protein